MTVEPKDLIREVAILADRCDISEEIVRLRAHLAQYRRDHRRARELGPEAGVPRARRWDERSTRSARRPATCEISRAVVEVKALLEKIRELVQNVE